MKEERKGFYALLASAFLYACFGLFVRQIDLMFGLYTQTFLRMGIAAILVGYFMLVTGGGFSFAKKKEFFNTILLGILTALLISSFTFAIIEIKVSVAVFLLYAGNILFSTLIGIFFFKEEFTVRNITAIVCTIIGLALFVDYAVIGVTILGLIAGFGSGTLEAISNTIRKTIKDTERNTVVFWQYGVASLVSFIFFISTSEVAFKSVNRLSIFVLILFSIMLAFLGNFLLYGLSRYPINTGTIVLASEILFATILGALFLYEFPTINELVGGGFILLSILILNTKLFDVAYKFFNY